MKKLKVRAFNLTHSNSNDISLKEDRFKYNALFSSYSKSFRFKNKIFFFLSLSKFNFLMVRDRANKSKNTKKC